MLLSLRDASGNHRCSSPLKHEKIRHIPGRDHSSSVRVREDDAYESKEPGSSPATGRRITSKKAVLRYLPGEFLEASVYTMAGRRFVVLAALLVIQSGSQLVLQRYEELIRNNVVIILFMSMVVGAGGNAGNQAAVSVTTAVLAFHGTANLPRGNKGEKSLEQCLSLERKQSDSVLSSSDTTSARPLRWNWEYFMSHFPSVVYQQGLRFWRRWRYFSSDNSDSGGGRTRRPLGFSLGVVLYYELIVGICCGVVLMIVGALRVVLFLWLDNDSGSNETYSSMASNASPSSLPLVEWGAGFALAVALSLSLFLIVFCSAFTGATLPYVLDHFGINLEHAAPIVQVLMDFLGTWLCCALCNIFLSPSPFSSPQKKDMD